MCDISVIVPCLNEVDYIEKCLISLISYSSCEFSYEIIVVDGGSTDGTLDKINCIINEFRIPITLLHNPERFTPKSLNIGINNSRGNYIARIDAHAEYPPNYLVNLLYWARKLDAENIGVPIDTVPGSKSMVAKVIADVMSSKIGVGASAFRVATINEPIKVDTVPFGFFKRSIFRAVGFFDEDLIRNQDDEFNARVIKFGGVIYLIPGDRVKYFSRSTMSKFSKMLFQYGLFKPLVSWKLRRLSTYRQLIPPLFAAYFIISFFVYVSTSDVFVFVPLVIYFALLIAYSLLKYKFSFAYSSLFFILVFVGHLSYGVGYINGLLRLIFNSQLSNSTDSR